jgi:aryl-alcohol dehydrogenase
MRIHAAVARAPDQPFEIVECDLAEPGSGEILVKIVACGICHTDLAVKAQHIPVSLPRILGHEGAGIVEAVGAGVTHLRPGDHVLMSYGSCGECPSCVSGATSYCAHSFSINFLGERGRGTTHANAGNVIPAGFFSQSSFATHAITTVRNTVRIDSDLPLKVLAPLGCGFQTGMGSVMLALRPRAGDSIAVYGCGAVGMAAIIAARIVGCSTIIAVDINSRRLALALEMGATHVIDSGTEDVFARIIEITKGGSHFAFDTTGVPSMADQALRALRTRGTAAFVAPSRSGTNLSFDARAIIAPGKTIRGVVQGDAVSSEFIPKMVDFYRRGLLPLEKLITTFEFDEINTAVHQLEEGQVLKAVLVMN